MGDEARTSGGRLRKRRRKLRMRQELDREVARTTERQVKTRMPETE
jgi:hypothetical protein